MFQIRYRLTLLVIFSISVLSVSSIAIQAEPVRLAIIDIDGKEYVPSALMDILLVELSNDPNITVLEREEIAQILYEQKINLSLNEKLASSDIIKTGQILAADAILMLQNEIKEENNNLRLRLVDARNGIKLIDSSLIIKTNSSELIEKTKSIALNIIQHIKRMNINPNQMLLIGVSTFKSEELTGRWDWLSDVIPTNIELNLALYSGIILMERTSVRPLLEEREFSEKLPESISASSILVNGSYQIDNLHNSITIFVRARRNNQIVFETNIERPLEEIEQICEGLVQKIIKEISSVPITKVMDPEIEAKMLGTEAETYLRREEFSRALSPAEAAHVLMPQSPEYMSFLLQSLEGLHWRVRAKSENEEKILSNYRFRALNLAERIIRNCPLPIDDNLVNREEKDGTLFLIHYWAMVASSKASSSLYDTKQISEDEYNEIAFSFFKICQERYSQDSLGLYERLIMDGHSLLSRIQNIDEAIKLADLLVTEQIRLHSNVDTFEFFINAVKKIWRDDKKDIENVENFLSIYRLSTLASFKHNALKASIQFYSELSLNHEILRNLSKEYIKFCKTNKWSINPSIVIKKPFFQDEKESEKYEIELLKEIMDFTLPKTIIQKQTQGWIKGVNRLIELLEKDGRTDDIITYMSKIREIPNYQRYSAWNELNKTFLEIQKKHPEIDLPTVSNKNKQTNENYKLDTDIILSTKDLKLFNFKSNNIIFHRLLIEGGEVYIIYKTQNEEQFGVIRLDRNNKDINNIKLYESTIKYNLRNNGSNFYRNPSVTVYKGDVYLGLINEGLIIFRHNGSMEQLNEKNVLAYNKIRNLECLGDKIYAILGTTDLDSGIMELDPKTGISKIITSSKVDVVKNEVDQKEICDIVPDPKRDVIWVYARYAEDAIKEEWGNRWNRLYCYNPGNGEFKRISTAELDLFLEYSGSVNNFHLLQIKEDYLLIFNCGSICELNLENMMSTTLIYNKNQCNPFLVPKWSSSSIPMKNILFLQLENGMICASSSHLFYFNENAKDPLNITNSLYNESISNKIIIKDLYATDDGLYILTADNLYFLKSDQFISIDTEKIQN